MSSVQAKHSGAAAKTQQLATSPTGPSRRSFAVSGLAGCAAVAGSSWASTAQAQTRSAQGRKNLGLIQIVDNSVGQQDITKDFVVGVRAAVSEVNQRGGIKGRSLSHQIIETDGTATSVDAALAQARNDAACVALMGTVGDSVARMVTERASLCQCAPWLMSELAVNQRTFNIFASRADQLAHIVRVLSVMSMRDVGVVYASRTEEASYATELRSAATASNLRVQSYTRQSEWRAVAQKLNVDAPPMVIFVGGTPEFIGLIQAMGPQTRQRFMVGLADVNLQTVQQLGVPKGLSVVATQVAPMVTSGLTVVRDYRAALNKYFDEPPTSQSLSGYISARVMFDLVKDFDASDPRGSAGEVMARRTSVELNGFSVFSQANRQNHPFVTQTMLSSDGRVLG